MYKLRIKTGDTVTVKSGAEKGKSGKVTKVLPKVNKVVVDGINVRTKHLKPTRTNPQGGVQKDAMPISAAKVGISHPKDSTRAARVGYKLAKDGAKKRINKANGKEI